MDLFYAIDVQIDWCQNKSLQMWIYKCGSINVDLQHKGGSTKMDRDRRLGPVPFVLAFSLICKIHKKSLWRGCHVPPGKTNKCVRWFPPWQRCVPFKFTF